MVPMSGWRKIRNMGAAAMAAARQTWSRRTSPLISERNAASAATMVSLANSEGWNWKPNRVIHRWAPAVSSPIGVSTSRSRNSTAPNARNA
jgi:hypothetical protein